jgi:ligand-binding sensor domain-containing protein
MKRIQNTVKFLFVTLILIACSSETDVTQTATKTPTIEPAFIPESETVMFRQIDEPSIDTSQYPNLWTQIDKTDIAIYSYNFSIADYAYDKDGSLWMVGGFGVLHRMPSGEQTIYSIKNGLSRQFFTHVAVSPTGEIWVGGIDNALFRFDGSQWIDEGEKLPSPYDDRTGWLCYSTNISGIDFGPDGSAWVMNGGIEIYTQTYGQWVNIPFPKEMLPFAGGGGCPRGLRVLAEDNITIMRNGCCENPPVGYHFDGEKWEENTDYFVVEELLAKRHPALNDKQNQLLDSNSYNSPEKLLPFSLYPTQDHRYSITSDTDGVVWINQGLDIYNNSLGFFKDVGRKVEYVGDSIWTSPWSGNVDVSQSMVVDFDADIYYYQEEKNPNRLEWIIENSEIGKIDVSHAAVGKNNHVWIVSPQEGLILVDHGNVEIIGRVPSIFATSQLGGVYVFQDGRIWVGSAGSIWEYQDGDWRQYIIPSTQELFTHFFEDHTGDVYGATDTSVYTFQKDGYVSHKFMNQNARTLVASEKEDCRYYKHYSTCPTSMLIESSGDLYKAVYLGSQIDGSIIYINNRLASKLKDGKWKSFFFNTFEITSATVDKSGYIWLLSYSDGLFRLDSDAFDAYQEILH